MKILLLNDSIPPEGIGGAEAVVWRLAQGLARADHDTHIITTTAAHTRQETRDGITIHYIRAGYHERFRAWLSLWNPQTAAPVSKLLARIQPDVVNAHNIHGMLGYHTLKLARTAGSGVVFSAHDAMAFAYGKLPATFAAQPGDYRLPRGYNLRQNRLRYNPLRNAIIKHYLREAHIRTAPSHALAAAFAANNMPPVEVAHNGIDLAEWAPLPTAQVQALRRKLDLEGKRVILIAGRLTRDKGLRQILLALERLRRNGPEVRLLVLTSRDVQAQAEAEFAHLRPFMRAAGWLEGDDLRAAYQLADIVTVPSIYLDPFPTVNLEAMALGKPVVASCFGGSSEVVQDGETGFIVNPQDTDQFANRLEHLLTDDSLRQEMGIRASQRIQDRFSLTRQVEQMLSIYQRAIASR